jgi:hypothetical protein
LKNKTLYETAWILGLIGGIICILFAVLKALNIAITIFEGPSFKDLSSIINAIVLGILGILILTFARMTRAGGEKAVTGGVFLLVLGLAAYLVGGGAGAVITILTSILAIIAKHI